MKWSLTVEGEGAGALARAAGAFAPTPTPTPTPTTTVASSPTSAPKSNANERGGPVAGGSLRSERLLEAAPRGIDGLPAYFAGLAAAQVDACWVACLVEAFAEERPTISQLAAACNAVREAYRRPRTGPEQKTEVEKAAGTLERAAPVARRRRPQEPGPGLAAAIGRALAVPPGEVVDASSITRGMSEMQSLRQFIQSGREPRLAWVAGGPGKKARVRRVETERGGVR